MIRIFLLTLRNDFKYALRYPMGWLVPVVSLAIFFLSILSAFPAGQADVSLRRNVFAGYMTLMLYLFVCQGPATSLSGKAAQGLLEREFVSPPDHMGITVIGLASEVASQIPFFFISGGILAWIAFANPLAILKAAVLLPTPMLFLLGMAIALLGLDLLWKRTGVLFQPLQFVMMIVAFACLPSERGIWQWIPYTAFAKGLRGVVGGSPPWAWVLDWRSPLVASFTFLLGCAVFRLCDRKAMIDGTISHF